MTIRITPRQVLASLLTILLVLSTAQFFVLLTTFYIGHDYLLGLVPLFNMVAEQNIPTLYSSVLLLVSSILLALITTKQKSLGNPYFLWMLLAVIFLFLAIDETAMLHENMGQIISANVETSGFFKYAWVIPYIVAAILLFVLYVRFLLALPKETGVLFFISGALYISGGVGLEMTGAWYHDTYGAVNLGYRIIQSFEELLEMLGITVFIYAQVLYLLNEYGELNLTFTSKT
ncbi:MAG: hypothetical protein GKR93_17860 [Gammaproteobacteria bacterium]|nr:hypothetical protein [Gammaproteobacteria bacterium]